MREQMHDPPTTEAPPCPSFRALQPLVTATLVTINITIVLMTGTYVVDTLVVIIKPSP